MVAAMVAVSVIAGGFSVLCSMLAGHPPLAWLAVYVLSGLCAALSLMVTLAREGEPADL